MPLTAGGSLSIVASADIGALGAREGSPVSYNWILPSAAPLLLPWLMILGLLTLKSNRCGAAWLILLPLGVISALTLFPPVRVPSDNSMLLLDAIGALAMGLAAVWLVANYLRRQNRFLTLLCFLFALAGFSGLAAAAKLGVNLLSLDTLPVIMVLGIGVLVSSVAMSLAGLITRRQYRPIGLYLWLVGLLATLWLLIALPFFIVAVISFGDRIPWSEFLIPVLSVSLANFVVLLPFLVLSSANHFFRERLKALLHVKTETPPVLTPPADPGITI